MKVFEAIKTAWTRAKNAAVASYDELVDAAVSDMPVDSEQAIAVLREAGKTPDDFAADVDRFKQRIAWRLEVDAAEQARLVVPGCNARLTKLEEEFSQQQAEAKAKFDTDRQAIEAEKRQAAATVARGEAAAGELRRTADPALVASLREATQNKPSGLTAGALSERRATVAHWQKEMAVAEQRLSQNPSHDGLQAELRTAKRRLDEATGELERAEKRDASQQEARASREEYIADLKLQVLTPWPSIFTEGPRGLLSLGLGRLGIPRPGRLMNHPFQELDHVER